ncbi:MAG: LEPR-XLL domain-containing protein, partial [Planctomycetota bacterium]
MFQGQSKSLDSDISSTPPPVEQLEPRLLFSGTVFTDGFSSDTVGAWVASAPGSFTTQTVVDGDGNSRDVLMAAGGGG